MNTKLITTEQMLDVVKREPNEEHEVSLCMGPILRSTHWMQYDTERGLFRNSTDWIHYDWFTEAELLQLYAGQWWVWYY